ncbi:YccF domain-containing protein [Vibrio salilacus]|uniref:YccF domain-containing protein n=1 Tax=Vibrio salilacus TaxID=1323749 RepID=UPI000C2A74E4|nr:YccF domain-containing protein [Vibrio salilacus]
MLRVLGNIIWFLCGGIIMGLMWWFFGLLAFISIIGIPWGRACFVMGNFSFFPFGQEAVSRNELTDELDIGTSPLGTIGNIIWFLLAGIWLAIGHIMSAVACFITIIGIPFALQHLKLALISLAPIGKTVVPKEQAAMARYGKR